MDHEAPAEQSVQELTERLDELLAMYDDGLTRIDALLDADQRATLAGDPVAAGVWRAPEVPRDGTAAELAERVDGVLASYDDGLGRIHAVLRDDQRAALADDPVVASVLLMHGLYPVPVEQRVLEALEEVRPYLQSHSGDVEFLAIEDGVAKLRLTGSCHGCGASAATLEQSIEGALQAAAPDLLGMDVEGVAAPVLIQLTRRAEPPVEMRWMALDGATDLRPGSHAGLRPNLFVANVDGTLLAYRDWCAGCPAPLSAGSLAGAVLTCTSCDRAYDLPRAGRQTDGDLQLEPVPLLRSGGEIKVSVPAEVADAEDEADHVHGDDGHCELCPIGLGDNHRHLLHLAERRIVCVCETCWSLRSGDAEFRPTGGRTLWLDDFVLDDEAWASFQIPIGLAFMLRSGLNDEIVILYPSPAGVTESELDTFAWMRLSGDNPVLDRLEPDAEALIINRLATPPQHVIAPLDECYRLVGMIKSRWSGISGGPELTATVAEFFDGLQAKAVAA